MHLILQVIIGVVICCTFFASLRVALVGLGHPSSNRIICGLTEDRWGGILFIFLPAYLGGFGRGEVSPLPWSAFTTAATHGGIAEAAFSTLVVLTIDLWLLWIPAHSYIKNHADLDRRSVALARWLNLAVGLLLLTPQNPFYQLVGLLPLSSE